MASNRIWRIGLTGGIGSGKSTVAGMLAALGAAIMDEPESENNLFSEPI